MSDSEVTRLPSEPDNPYTLALAILVRGTAAILLVMGLRHWVYIAGVFTEPGWNLLSMSSAWRFVTVQLAVVDLVAAVGLWMRVSWGNVLWLYAAIFEIVIHTILAARFGLDIPVLAFHILTLGGFAALLILERRYEAKPGKDAP
jgi:hypothetical protein